MIENLAQSIFRSVRLVLLRSLRFNVACVAWVLAVELRAQTILPDPTAGQAYSFQITTSPAQTASTTYSAEGLPVGLSINSASGLISGTTTTVGAYKGNLSFVANSSTTLYPYQITVDPAPGTPVITSSGGPGGTVGTPFSYTIAATNNPTSYTIALLPPGLTASGGLISGTPTTAGLSFTSVSANNANGQGAILVLMFTINPAGALPVVTSALVLTNPVGAAFTYQITASNNPNSYSATGLPSGLSLNTSTGVISGTPTVAGISNVSLIAANTFGNSLKVNLSLTVGSYSSITSASAVPAMVGSALTYTLTADNSPFTFNLAGLPAGLTYNNATGLVSGTPTTSGNYTVTASANNALGTGATKALTFAVGNANSLGGGNLTAPAILVQPVGVSATVGSTLQLSVTAVGSGTLSFQWQHNNNPISGATAPLLTLGGIQSADAGSYQVVVSNSLGAVSSALATVNVLSIIVPPSITSQPDKTTATVGTSASFTVGASGSIPLTFQWQVNGLPIAGATLETLTLPSIKVSDAGNYSVVVSNPFGSKASISVPLTVSATPFAPIFQFNPSPVSVTIGGTASLSVGVIGSPPISYQWFKSGVAIPGANSTSLTFANAQPADAGVFSVSITDPAGTVTSSTATVTVTPAGSTPVPVTFAQQPVPLSSTIGASATFTVAVIGDPAISYQWRKNQIAIAGATTSSFTIPNVQTSDAATYDIVIANGFSANISFPTLLIVTPGGGPGPAAVPSRIINVSTRALNGIGDQALFIGFTIGGTGTKSALVRAVGPTLSNFGVTGVLADPQLTVFSATSQPIVSNDNWGGSAALTTAFLQVGAFPLPATSLDSALVTTFSVGSYTGEVSGPNSGTGVALLELYDNDPAATPTARLINVSGRGFAGTGSNVLTIGFVINGTTTETLLIRAIGPTLAGFSIGGVMADPQLTVLDANQNVVGSNNDWSGTAALTAAFSKVSAFPLPITSKDAALLVTLGPGVYTAQVSGVNGTTGVALLEMYEMP